ncbi:MAG: ROK family protein [Cellvibrionales bacterium]|nr:ROK family protein [Cellvibrionales bacterium]
MDKLYGAIEGGGTKFVCAVGGGGEQILAKTVIPTRDPEVTLASVAQFFQQQTQRHGPLVSVGLGNFGPLDIDPKSRTYGQIMQTPKPGWAGFDLVADLMRRLAVPIALDTDVNCALLAEAQYGAGRGCGDLVYLTVGTGIGGGVLSGGWRVRGTGHPEIGHLFVPKHPDDGFAGACPFHGDQCIEGLASGPAIEQRWGCPAQNLPAAHPAWELQAHYLALLCHNLFMTVAPVRIILGGGVMAQAQLFPMIRTRCAALANGYGVPPGGRDWEAAIRPVALGGEAGIRGAFLIAAADGVNDRV